MATRTGYAKSYLSNVEHGRRRVTPAMIRAYERVLGGDVQRRQLFIAAAATAVTAALPDALPDVAADVVRDITAERADLLSRVQTSHATDRTIGQLVARDQPCVASLTRWARKGSPVLRVNSVGILAKLRAPTIDDQVIASLRADDEARLLYLTAVNARVLGLPWDDASELAASGRGLAEPDQVERFAAEALNVHDSGARWCCVLMLGRTRHDAPAAVEHALRAALRAETSTEVLRSIAGTLAGLDPLTV